MTPQRRERASPGTGTGLRVESTLAALPYELSRDMSSSRKNGQHPFDPPLRLAGTRERRVPDPRAIILVPLAIVWSFVTYGVTATVVGSAILGSAVFLFVDRKRQPPSPVDHEKS
ncbi:hypothetical protein [Rathayibacter sp. VKM Ac-2801]|uniref:hypothetical protein n=1 Tax=Rathayibacter sp. VKM Ac-2801 TaxID=2609255 RepID=UPI00131FF514|nr:hypothetical protein [Rathayibacter sp. VKM Ac-2801]QHC69366.1 hypothetical protein GSU45_02520 [Rathayibacter sp. VKM Ac-2801]